MSEYVIFKLIPEVQRYCPEYIEKYQKKYNYFFFQRRFINFFNIGCNYNCSLGKNQQCVNFEFRFKNRYNYESCQEPNPEEYFID